MKTALSAAVTGARLTSMRVGGEISRFHVPAGFGDAVKVLDATARGGERARVIGGGTNLLIDDDGVDFPVISTAKLRRLRVGSDGTVTAEAGVSLFRLVVSSARAGLSGLEALAGIPGTVGGAIAMNAGAFGACVSDTIDSVDTAVPLVGIAHLRHEDLSFGYRRSSLRGSLVLSATFRLRPDDPAAVRERIERFLAKRKTGQPRGMASAGCFFRNPGKVSAGLLIEKAGLKGFRAGGAMVSPVHANFIVNIGRATCSDVMTLASLVRGEVLRKNGIRLRMEVRYWKSSAVGAGSKPAVAALRASGN